MSAGDQARKSKSQRLGPHVARALAIKNLLDVLPCLSAHERLVSSLVQASAPFKGSRVQAIPQHVVDRAGSDGLLAPTIPQSCGPRSLGDVLQGVITRLKPFETTRHAGSEIRVGNKYILALWDHHAAKNEGSLGEPEEAR